jgi:hypothetical protein
MPSPGGKGLRLSKGFPSVRLRFCSDAEIDHEKTVTPGENESRDNREPVVLNSALRSV